MDKREEYRKKILDAAYKYGDISPSDDGFQYYWGTQRGALSAESLRVIADELDRLNGPWEQQINEYFSNLET